MAKCIQVLKVCKTADERQDFSFNLTDEFARHWEPDHPFPAGAVIRPSIGIGVEMLSDGGQSNGELEPEWAAEGTTDEGSILWTPQPFSTAGLKHRIVDVVWTAPAGITASDQVETDDPGLQEIRIWISGGTPGVKYTITALVETTLGAFFECRLEVSVE